MGRGASFSKQVSPKAGPHQFAGCRRRAFSLNAVCCFASSFSYKLRPGPFSYWAVIKRDGMRVRSEFPFAIENIDHVWIPLSDGIKLAARIWFPVNAEDDPVPALLEYLPYRKNDGTAERDALRQPYFAGHGYAAVRVDMRGSGDSDGILRDEYLKQEQDDALEVLNWIARQPWCNGKIGMHGISWGGFNSLQVAARRPPELCAVMAIGFSDDRYNDDVHYMGGCLLTRQMLSWASEMFVYNAAPPDPLSVGERWREIWLNRMESTPPYVETWLTHQRRDEYWRQGSVAEDYAAIQVPVYAVGGWADSYNNSIPRLLTNLRVPCKALIGPWAHGFPESATPGPAIGFLQESLRWWDYWLKGVDTGIIAEPVLRCWIQTSCSPAHYYSERPGFWHVESVFPSSHVSMRSWYLNGSCRLDETACAEQTQYIAGVQSHGLDCGGWGMGGVPGDFPGDQRATDGEALSFTSAPLTAPLVILGRPEVEVSLASDRALALLAVRLCEVGPSGVSTLISYGMLNLAQRDSQEHPEELLPGRRYKVTVKLNMCGHRFSKDNRIRIALSPTYLHYAWPSPVSTMLTVFCGAESIVNLPVRHIEGNNMDLVDFPPPEIAPPLEVVRRRAASREQVIERNLATDQTALRTRTDGGCVRYPCGMETQEKSVQCLSMTENDPLSVRHDIHRELQYRRGDWSVVITTLSKMWCDATYFYIDNHLLACEGERQVFEKSLEFRILRDFL